MESTIVDPTCLHCKSPIGKAKSAELRYRGPVGGNMEYVHYVHDYCLKLMFDWITKQMKKEKLEKDIKDSEMRTGWKYQSDDLNELEGIALKMKFYSADLRAKSLLEERDMFKWNIGVMLHNFALDILNFVKRKSND